jgi:phosphoribosylformylglycinamidine synthase
MCGGLVAGRPPVLDLELEGAVQSAVREAVRSGLLSSAHDCSEGGIAITLAESVIASGLGASVVLDDGLPAVASLFSETASRIVVSCDPDNADTVLDLLQKHQVPYSVIGEVGGEVLSIGTSDEAAGIIKLPLKQIAKVYDETLEQLVTVR